MYIPSSDTEIESALAKLSGTLEIKQEFGDEKDKDKAWGIRFDNIKYDRIKVEDNLGEYSKEY